jgi:hypothetical protein
LISCFRATGITTDVVERMENDLKRDVRREVRTGNGRILLHDELEHVPGQFTLTPQWETLSVDDIMTPRVSVDGVQLVNGRLTFPVPKDVFELVIREGYKVTVNSTLNIVVANWPGFRLTMHALQSRTNRHHYLKRSRRYFIECEKPSNTVEI